MQTKEIEKLQVHEMYTEQFLTDDQKTIIICKAEKMGFSASFSEMGAGTVLTFIKE